MIKFTILLRRNPSMTHDQFVAYHRDNHAGLFASLPEVRQHVRRYVQCHTVPATIPGLPPVTFDGITEVWFDDVAGLEAVFSSDSYMRTIRPDEAKFLDLHGREFVLTTEKGGDRLRLARPPGRAGHPWPGGPPASGAPLTCNVR